MEEIKQEYKQKAKDYLSEPEYIVVSQWFEEITDLVVSKERERVTKGVKDKVIFNVSSGREYDGDIFSKEVIGIINTK